MGDKFRTGHNRCETVTSLAHCTIGTQKVVTAGTEDGGVFSWWVSIDDVSMSVDGAPFLCGLHIQ